MLKRWPPRHQINDLGSGANLNQRRSSWRTKTARTHGESGLHEVLHYLRPIDDLLALLRRQPWVSPDSNFVTAFSAAI